MTVVNTAGKQILVARRGENYYAADNRCPHMGGDLSMGKLEGTVVTCPRHGSQFDLTDGRVIRWTNMPWLLATLSKIFKSPRPIATYKVTIGRDKVLVEI